VRSVLYPSAGRRALVGTMCDWYSRKDLCNLARVNPNSNFEFKFSMRKLSLPVHSSEIEPMVCREINV
jgi:hypothetical protein